MAESPVQTGDPWNLIRLKPAKGGDMKKVFSFQFLVLQAWPLLRIRCSAGGSVNRRIASLFRVLTFFGLFLLPQRRSNGLGFQP